MKQIKRTFIPGSECLYFKIYAGYKTIDRILSKEIPIIISKLKKEGLLKKWFFIRYADPDSHIRIRFWITDPLDIREIIHLIYSQLNKLVSHNFIWKIQIDTYYRELERYSYTLINDSELIFQKDSECILSIINKIHSYQNESYRWMIALSMIDSLLNDFGFDLSTKLQFIETLCISYKKEFGFNSYNSKQFNQKYRKHKRTVELILKNEFPDNQFLHLCRDINKRTIENKKIIDQLYLKLKGCNNSIHLNSLLSSYVHMMMNRLFISQNRIYELVLYDFLKRYYTSELARSKYNSEA